MWLRVMTDAAVGVPYDQRLARRLAPLLARLGLTPNQVTALSLLLALLAAFLFVLGEPAYAHWGAGVFVLARLLDHFDGELARLSGRASRFGYYFDYVVGTISYGAIFAAIGWHLSQGELGLWAWLLAALAIFAAVLTLPLNLILDREKGYEEGEAVGYPGLAGFELEDGLYLLAPITWLGWLAPFFVLIGLGATLYLLWTAWRVLRIRLARRSSSPTSSNSSTSAAS